MNFTAIEARAMVMPVVEKVDNEIYIMGHDIKGTYFCLPLSVMATENLSILLSHYASKIRAETRIADAALTEMELAG
jgi:hypothetical protein